MTVNTQENIEAPKPTEKELNFERLRKQLEQEKAEKLQMQQRLEAIERAQKASKNDDEDDSDEPYMDHKSFNKKMNKFEEKLEEKIDRRAEEKARILLEQEKQRDYMQKNPDFSQVLSAENIDKFAREHPAIAERMLKMPDTFDRQALLYEQMKAIQASKKVEEEKSAVQQKIDQNRRTPFYQPSGIGASPYAAAGDFSPAGQKSAYEKLQELKSRLRL